MPSQVFCAVAFDFETNECCTVFTRPSCILNLFM